MDDEDDGEHSCAAKEASAAAALPSSAAAVAAATPVPAPLPQQHVRLAVVVVPTLLSTLHCARCSSEALDAPLPRALLTRRPRSMRAFPASWVFPGGVCDASDRSLAHTGARELLEETGLSVDEAHCQLVAMWEAVFPVIRPMALPLHEPFQPKGRYLITMFAAPVHNTQSASTAAAASDDTTSAPSSSSSPSPSVPLPCCLGCSPPASLQLCPTEVDASVWVSPHELEALRAHAAYTHTEREDELQKQQQQPQPPHEQQLQQSPLPPQRCLAGTETCQCAELPALVTRAFLAETATRARLVERSEVSSSLSASSTATTTGASDEPAQQQFLPALVRCCVLFGLYPNREGSGVAEGHLVALEEMRAQGLFA
jgi:8-oxo-dGTP pyrophosphatase MutT (NUDIX family)